MSESLHLAELLCSRLCHDLSGPIGALVGVLEIACEEPAGGEALAMAEEIAAELVTRLRLLRAAWGQNAEPLDIQQLRTYGESLASTRRLRVDLTGLQADSVFPPQAGRLILNMLLLAAESLPRGGVVALAGSSATHLVVTIAGPRAAWPPGLGACLTDEASARTALTSARALQAPLTALIARGHGLHLSLLMPGGPAGDADVPPPLLLSFVP